VECEDHNSRQSTHRKSTRKQRLLAMARARTKHEQSLSLSTDTPHYAAAALAQTPYVALPNGSVIIVQRKGGWGC
jgi:hypothetical protein